MAVKIPTLKEIKQQILNDIATEFSVDVSELGFTYVVWASVQAGVLWVAYLLLSRVQKNIYYDLAEPDVLIRYGAAILGRTPAPAEQGEYIVQVTGTIGATISEGTQFVANDTTLAAGSLFVVDQDFTLSATTDSLPIRALEAGIESALFVDDLLTSAAPIADVESEVIVLSITKQPTAAESIESYREDVIAAARIEPQGGSPGDYRLWTLEIPEVRTSYPFAKEGSPGDIEIYVEATEENTAPAEIIGVPTQQTLDDVYKAETLVDPEQGIVVINPTTGKGRKPMGVFNVYSLPVTPNPVDLEFVDLSDDSIADSLKTAIELYLYDVRPYVAGADIIANKNDILTIGAIIAVVIQVLSGTGITYTNLTIKVNDVEVQEYTFRLGNYPYLRFINNNGNPI
jgi:hypothetical protein